MLLILLAAGIYGQFSEKLPYGDGFGWDGQVYGSMARDLNIRELEPYYLPRILPSIIVHYSMLALRVDFTNDNIVRAFSVFNFILILLSFLVWILIARDLHLSIRGRWLGFIGLFINFPLMKMAFYYCVLTDTAAFTAGLLLFYFFLRKKIWGIFITIIAGAFTWPVIVICGIALILFVPNPVKVIDKKNTVLSLTAAALFTAGYFSLIAWFYLIKGFVTTNPGSMIQPIVESVVAISIFLAVLYAFFMVKGLFEHVSFLSFFSSMRTSVLRVILCAAIVALQFYVPRLSTVASTNVRMEYFLMVIGLLSIRLPLITFVAHVIFYGPIIILLALFWKDVCGEVRRYGVGLMLMVVFSLFISLSPESRQALNALPVFIILLVKVTERLNWKPTIYWAVGIIAAIASKVWLPINRQPSELRPNIQYERYFLNQAPWMFQKWYIIQGICVLAVTLLLVYLVWKRGSSENLTANGELQMTV